MTTRFVFVAWITQMLVALPRVCGSSNSETTPVPLGCRKTDETNPAMPDGWTEDKVNMNQDLCIDFCSLDEKTFAGVQKGYLCWCSHNFPKYEVLPDLNCRTLCAGNPVEYCGGENAITAFGVCDENHYGPKCDLPCMCSNHEVCNFMTGICPNKVCESGWQGERCDMVVPKTYSNYQEKLIKFADYILALGKRIKSYFVLTEDPPAECDAGFYGILCKSLCHCATGVKCQRLTGICEVGGCSFGWLGQRCDKPDPCAVNPCDNNGKCILWGFRMHCECPTGFSGANCEFADPCLKKPCQNDGTCFTNRTEFKCECRGDFSGLLCETNVKNLPNTPVYLGCFREYGKEREFPRQIKDLETVTPTTCTKRCKAKLYTFAALQNGGECWCSNSYAQYGALPEKDCNRPCSGDASAKCGAPDVNSVYAVCIIGRYRVDCKGLCNCFAAQCNIDSGLCPNPYCQVGYFGEKCDQAKVETAETYKKSRQFIAYGIGALAALTVVESLGVASLMLLGKNGQQIPKSPNKTSQDNDVESQKKELEALLGKSSEKKTAAGAKTSKSSSSKSVN